MAECCPFGEHASAVCGASRVARLPTVNHDASCWAFFVGAMMSRLHLVVGLALLVPGSAWAGDSDFFAGLDMSGGLASGSSSTTDGGAAFAGGGVVGNVRFDGTVGIGGHVGYRFDPSWSAFVSYEHIRGGVSWDASFPLYGVTSDFDGDATSNVVLGNLAYDWALSDTTTIGANAGLGLSINSLSGIVETDRGTGLFLSDVEDHTHLSPAARLGVGLQHKIAPNVVLGLNAAVSYVGGFETGDTRSGNLGVTAITPYKIDDVWRGSLGASLKVAF